MRQVYYWAEKEHTNVVIQMSNQFFRLLRNISDIQLQTDKFDIEFV